MKLGNDITERTLMVPSLWRFLVFIAEAGARANVALDATSVSPSAPRWVQRFFLDLQSEQAGPPRFFTTLGTVVSTAVVENDPRSLALERRDGGDWGLHTCIHWVQPNGHV